MRRYSLFIAIAVFAIAQFGCVTVRGSGASTSKPSNVTTITSQQITQFRLRHRECRAKVEELRLDKKQSIKRARIQSKKLLSQCQIRLNACHKQAQVKHKCPSCIKPALVVGIIAGSVGLAVGVVAGVVATLAIKGDLNP